MWMRDNDRDVADRGAVTRSYVLVVLFAAVFLTSCGDAEPTVAEYSTQMQQAVTAMNAQIDRADVGLEAAASMDEVLALWDERLLARATLISTIETLDPPDEVVELRAAALDILTRLLAAETAMRDKGAEFTAMEQFSGIWDSPEGQAARAVDAEAVAICQAVESNLSDEGGTEFGVAVWLRPELREVVDVVFGCIPEDRPRAP